MAQHTPGPWERNGLTIETVAEPSIVLGCAYDEYASCGGIESDSEAEANARLIAAAPDLLAALIGIAFFSIDDWTDANRHETGPQAAALRAAHAAILKAGGQFPSDLS